MTNRDRAIQQRTSGAKGWLQMVDDGEKKGSGRIDAQRGLTAKQEAFAQGVAKGLTLTVAYEAAYDCSKMKRASIQTEASKAMDHPAIAQRISELIEVRAARTMAADAKAIRQHVFERLMAESTDENNPAASRVRALELMGKMDIVQMFSDKAEGPKSDRLTPEELERKLMERLARLAPGSGSA